MTDWLVNMVAANFKIFEFLRELLEDELVEVGEIRG